MTAWRLLLRLAWREARRARGRSILVLVMIALPVLGVTAAAVAYRTMEVSGVEALDRTIGAADAGLSLAPGSTAVVQAFDPAEFSSAEYDKDAAAPDLADVERVLGRQVPALERVERSVQVRTDRGVADVDVTEIDLRDPLAHGLFTLTSGRLPANPDEVVVNGAVTDRGPTPGESLRLADDRSLEIVGTVESAVATGFPMAVGLRGAFGADNASYGQTLLVGGGPVTWPEVQRLNAIGATVTSRAVITDPPPRTQLPAEVLNIPSGLDDTTLAVVGLVVAMALLEVVLLAGPAFAVSARRQSRSIALMVASGGTPAQARRLVLANGLVLGAVASVLGVVIGLGIGRLAMPVLQHFSTSVFGPYDVPWWTVAAVAGFGLLSALMAAVVPAWIASRQDVVAVLAGRRGDRAQSTRSPLVGVALLGLGIASATFGAASGGGELLIGVAAVLSVLGMILVVPLVLAGLARAASRLPLAGRYAVRDAARHRTRTVPAVAAVAATVAGVVTLGIAGSSDQAEAQETYEASLHSGTGVVTAYEPDVEWATLRGVVASTSPAATVTELSGVPESFDPEAETYRYARVQRPGHRTSPLASYGGTFGSLVVSDGALPTGLDLIPADRVGEAAQILESGGMVAFADDPRAGGWSDAEIVVEESAADTGETLRTDRLSVPTLWLTPTRPSTPSAVLSPEAAEAAGLDVATTALVLTGTPVTEAQQADISEALTAASTTASLYVERGFQPDEGWVVVLLILGGLAAVLMLGGTLTATFLGLSDARPDLATLAAVGASPQSRRWVAASFALVVGFLGAVLGAAVGFIPGIAITYPLTVATGDAAVGGSGYLSATEAHSGPYLDVPWLLIVSLVVVLPLLTALVVGLTVRSRLPMVARVA